MAFCLTRRIPFLRLIRSIYYTPHLRYMVLFNFQDNYNYYFKITIKIDLLLFRGVYILFAYSVLKTISENTITLEMPLIMNMNESATRICQQKQTYRPRAKYSKRNKKYSNEDLMILVAKFIKRF
jgi:hypothetical protein